MSSKAAKAEQARKDGLVAQFRQVTGANQNDAIKFLKKYGYKLDAALDGLYNDPVALAQISASGSGANGAGGVSVKKIGEIFDKYKDEDSENIIVEGTMQFCSDISLDLEDVAILALSHELHSPQMGVFTRQGWTDGWKALKCDSLEAMKGGVATLRTRLERGAKEGLVAASSGSGSAGSGGTGGAGEGAQFFKAVYMYAFEFAKAPGQRSIPVDNAKAFWGMLLPLITSASSSGDGGWKAEHTEWWFEFLDEKKTKGISKDAWSMFLDFIQTIDGKFEKYDENAAWPSLIDDFVEWGREKIRT